MDKFMRLVSDRPKYFCWAFRCLRYRNPRRTEKQSADRTELAVQTSSVKEKISTIGNRTRNWFGVNAMHLYDDNNIHSRSHIGGSFSFASNIRNDRTASAGSYDIRFDCNIIKVWSHGVMSKLPHSERLHASSCISLWRINTISSTFRNWTASGKEKKNTRN